MNEVYYVHCKKPEGCFIMVILCSYTSITVSDWEVPFTMATYLLIIISYHHEISGHSKRKFPNY